MCLSIESPEPLCSKEFILKERSGLCLALGSYLYPLGILQVTGDVFVAHGGPLGPHLRLTLTRWPMVGPWVVYTKRRIQGGGWPWSTMRLEGWGFGPHDTLLTSKEGRGIEFYHVGNSINHTCVMKPQSKFWTPKLREASLVDNTLSHFSVGKITHRGRWKLCLSFPHLDPSVPPFGWV